MFFFSISSIKPWVLIYATQRKQYEGQGVYYGLSTASEVLLSFTTQLYSCLCNYNFHILTRGEYCSRNTPNHQYSSLPVGSKLSKLHSQIS